MHVWMYGCMDVCMFVCIDAWMHACMYVCMYACMHASDPLALHLEIDCNATSRCNQSLRVYQA